MDDLLLLKQRGSVDEYVTQFEELYYQISMHNSGYDPVFFISQFINGLKYDIRVAVQTQVPTTLHRVLCWPSCRKEWWTEVKISFRSLF